MDDPIRYSGRYAIAFEDLLRSVQVADVGIPDCCLYGSSLDVIATALGDHIGHYDVCSDGSDLLSITAPDWRLLRQPGWQ